MRSWIRDPSLTFTIPNSTSVFARIPTRGIGAKLPPPVLELLAFCATARTEAELHARYGATGLHTVSQLAAVGLLVDPEQSHHTPLFFHNFAALDVHRRMLADHARLDAYATAIAAQVKPGMVVLDAGTGTGVLACLAALAGARVYGVDASDVVEAAQGVVDASGLGAQVTLLRGDFRTLSLPEPVDLVVTETFGAWGLAEAGVADLIETCQRHLKPGGRVIPAGLSLWVAPLHDTAPLAEALGPFRRWRGVALDTLLPTALCRGITVDVRPEQLAHPGTCLSALAIPCPIAAQGVLHFDTPGPIHGFAAWFDLDMGEGQTLSTGPHAPRTHWRQQLLPIEIPGAGPTELTLQLSAPAHDRRGLEVHAAWRRGEHHGERVLQLR